VMSYVLHVLDSLASLHEWTPMEATVAVMVAMTIGACYVDKVIEGGIWLFEKCCAPYEWWRDWQDTREQHALMRVIEEEAKRARAAEVLHQQPARAVGRTAGPRALRPVARRVEPLECGRVIKFQRRDGVTVH